MTVSPTRRQADAWRFIAGFQEAHGGVSPTFTDMMAGLGSRSKGNVHHLLTGLGRAKAIRRLRAKHQAIELLQPVSIPRSPTGEPLYYVPIHPGQGGR